MKNLLALILVLFVGVAHAVPTTLTVVQLSETSAAFAENSGDTSNGNRVLNPNGDVFFVLRNTHATNSQDFIFTPGNTALTVPGWGPLTKSAVTVSVAAGVVKYFGPLGSAAWNDTSGYIQVTYSGTGTPKISPVRALRP